MQKAAIIILSLLISYSVINADDNFITSRIPGAAVIKQVQGNFNDYQGIDTVAIYTLRNQNLSDDLIRLKYGIPLTE
ncbi:MAG: hypothetical protein V1843_04310, partial [bacterium]